jgi:hypothetical protein
LKKQSQFADERKRRKALSVKHLRQYLALPGTKKQSQFKPNSKHVLSAAERANLTLSGIVPGNVPVPILVQGIPRMKQRKTLKNTIRRFEFLKYTCYFIANIS